MRGIDVAIVVLFVALIGIVVAWVVTPSVQFQPAPVSQVTVGEVFGFGDNGLTAPIVFVEPTFPFGTTILPTDINAPAQGNQPDGSDSNMWISANLGNNVDARICIRANHDMWLDGINGPNNILLSSQAGNPAWGYTYQSATDAQPTNDGDLTQFLTTTDSSVTQSLSPGAQENFRFWLDIGLPSQPPGTYDNQLTFIVESFDTGPTC